MPFFSLRSLRSRHTDGGQARRCLCYGLLPLGSDPDRQRPAHSTGYQVPVPRTSLPPETVPPGDSETYPFASRNVTFTCRGGGEWGFIGRQRRKRAGRARSEAKRLAPVRGIRCVQGQIVCQARPSFKCSMVL